MISSALHRLTLTVLLAGAAYGCNVQQSVVMQHAPLWTPPVGPGISARFSMPTTYPLPNGGCVKCHETAKLEPFYRKPTTPAGACERTGKSQPYQMWYGPQTPR